MIQLQRDNQQLSRQLAEAKSELSGRQVQVEQLRERRERLAVDIQEVESQMAEERETLAMSREELQQSLDAMEEDVDEREALLGEREEFRINVDEKRDEVRALRDAQHQLQLKQQTLQTEVRSLQASLERASQQKTRAQERLTRLKEQLSEREDPSDQLKEELEQKLERLAARIQRLGPINLAAIEEYQTQSERKRYLDEQDDDLQRALETLENAIRKIDRETRTRFKDTFDRVNQGLQDLFPKVFGGGHAYLELTGDDLLDTGVAIMARPPGKRNSTIHLLSGGEKALTAIALVFSIFRLNPSPFCMLDEVDAPLDDANVGRYARLVQAMSEHVQFIYITHNKIAMEMAHQLMGVTMNEPGVSRLVSVNVEEAAELAAI